VVMEPNDPGVDPVLEAQLGAQRFAAVAAGDNHTPLPGSPSEPEVSR